MGIVECFSCSKLLLVIGVLTIIGARISAIFEKDIKKVVALSTLRQLGVIAISLGINNSFISFIHLIIRAFFKAIIFIRVGQLIHNFNNYQLIKITGGSSISRPFIIIIFISSSISLRGVPFAAAFFSKEPIIDILLIDGINLFRYIFILIGAFFTILYSLRLCLIIRIKNNNIIKIIMINETFSFSMIRALILFLPSFFRGVIINKLLNFFFFHPLRIIIKNMIIIFFVFVTYLFFNLNKTLSNIYITK